MRKKVLFSEMVISCAPHERDLKKRARAVAVGALRHELACGNK